MKRHLAHRGPSRRVLLNCYYRLQSRRRTCACGVCLVALLLTLSAVFDTRVRGQKRCGSYVGFVRSKWGHPFSMPMVTSYVSTWAVGCHAHTGPRAGYCLCDDNDETTTIAAPKARGSEPVRCEAACRNSPIVGVKTQACTVKPRPACTDTRSHENLLKPSKAMLDLARTFSRSRGPDLGVSLPPGSRRNLNTDFVYFDRRMSKGDVEIVKRRVEKFKREAPRYPETSGVGGKSSSRGNGEVMFSGRGIVIVAGSAPKYATSYWVVIHALRRAGSSLPIQLWFPEGEMPDCVRVQELKRLHVDVVSFGDFQGANAGEASSAITGRFMYKLVALIFSSFEEVLLLDSDNIPLRDPAELFESDLYKQTGSLLWMDFWRGSSAPDCQEVLGNMTRVRHTHETGQLVVKKSQTWSALALAFFMNAHLDLFYPLTVNYMGLGDKEILAFAFLHLNVPYGLVPHGPDHVGLRDNHAAVLGNSMLQHGTDGVPMFLHTNLGKPMGFVPASEATYVRRWRVSLQHGAGLPEVINAAAGVEDFEMWYYRLIRNHRCFFDDRPAKHWYYKLAVGPFVEGFHITDHAFINTELKAVSGLVEQGYIAG